jgi:hypothetical protein
VPTLPGIGVDTLADLNKSKYKIIFNYYKLLSLFPGIKKLRRPVPVAYDAVSVSRKP